MGKHFFGEVQTHDRFLGQPFLNHFYVQVLIFLEVYSCVFFFLTGFHFFHLLLGLLLLILLFWSCSFSFKIISSCILHYQSFIFAFSNIFLRNSWSCIWHSSLHVFNLFKLSFVLLIFNFFVLMVLRFYDSKFMKAKQLLVPPWETCLITSWIFILRINSLWLKIWRERACQR